jgi:hypothetical protein
VDPVEVIEGGVRDARLAAIAHVKRINSLEVDERGVRDTRLVARRKPSSLLFIVSLETVRLHIL